MNIFGSVTSQWDHMSAGWLVGFTSMLQSEHLFFSLLYWLFTFIGKLILFFSIRSPFNFAENLHYISFSHSIKLFYLHGLTIELPRLITCLHCSNMKMNFLFYFSYIIFFSLSYFLTSLSGNISKDKCSGRSMKVWLSVLLGKYNRPTNQQTDMGVHRRVTLPTKIIHNPNSLRL